MSDVNTIDIAAVSKVLIVLGILNQTSGTAYAGAFTVALVPIGTEPTVFAAPDVSGSYSGIMVGPGSTLGTLAAGYYQPWVKLTDVSPEVPVVKTSQIVHIF